MFYDIPFEKLSYYKYPNLVAEVVETGYSICAISEHMGLGRCKENDSIICEKIFGKKKIMLNEAFGLCRLFNCEAGYLFAEELQTIEDKSLAYYRHYERNKRIMENAERRDFCEAMREFLDNNPDLFLTIKEIIKFDRIYIEKISNLFNEIAV